MSSAFFHNESVTSKTCYNPNNLEYLNKLDQLMKYTDLVMLDIKHINPVEHNKLTGHSNVAILDFAKYLSEKKVPVWIRHVVVPNITFNKIHLTKLGEFLATLDNIKALDILPYHDMGIVKYESLKKEYPLKGTPVLNKQQAMEARDVILDSMKKTRIALNQQNNSN